MNVIKNLSDCIHPADGPELFERALSCGWSQVIISTKPLSARLGPPGAAEASEPLERSAPSRAPRHRHPRRALGLREPDRPRNHVEEALASLWKDALGVDEVGIHEDFFELGGDSLLAVQMLAKARQRLKADLPPHSLVERPTIAKLAESISPPSSAEPRRPSPETLVCLREGRGTPLFLIHPVGGHVYVYRDLLASLPRDLPVYGIRARAAGADPTSIPALAAAYRRDLQSIQERGPYLLGGSSLGGILAYEMARQLVEAGHEVPVLAMLDSPGPGCLPATFDDDASILGYLLCQGRPSSNELARLRGFSREELVEHFLERASGQHRHVQAESIAEVLSLLLIWRANQRALWTYEPAPYPGRILFFTATEPDGVNVEHPERAWSPLARGGIEVYAVPGTHITMNHQPNVGVVGEVLGPAITKALAAGQVTSRG